MDILSIDSHIQISGLADKPSSKPCPAESQHLGSADEPIAGGICLNLSRGPLQALPVNIPTSLHQVIRYMIGRPSLIPVAFWGGLCCFATSAFVYPQVARVD